MDANPSSAHDKAQWLEQALCVATPASLHSPAPVFSFRALVCGHADPRLASVENLFFYGPQLSTLLTIVLVSNILFHAIVAGVASGLTRELSYVAVACGVFCVGGIKISERIWLPHRTDSFVVSKKVFLALWMVGVTTWSTIGALASDEDSCSNASLENACRRIPSFEAPAFIVVFAWLRVAHPCWLILQAITSVVMVGAAHTYFPHAETSTVQIMVAAVLVAVWEVLSAVAWWLAFRPTLEGVIALRRTDKALHDARSQIATLLSRVVPDAACCEGIVWQRHWVARSTGDALLVVSHVSTPPATVQTPTDMWSWRDALASHFGETWAATNVSSAHKQRSGSRSFLVCSVGDVLHCVWECPENESLLLKETKLFLKYVGRFDAGLHRLDAQRSVRTVLHRGFTTCVCVGSRGVEPLLLGSAGVEASIALGFAQGGLICATSTVAHQIHRCSGWTCSESIATFSTPMNELTLDLVVVRVDGGANPTVDAPADDALPSLRRGKGDRKGVTIVAVPGEGGIGEGSNEGGTTVEIFRQLAHRHPTTRLQTQSSASRRTTSVAYDELRQALPSLVVPALPKLFDFGAVGSDAKWAFLEATFVVDCAYECFVERLIAMVICAMASTSLTVLAVADVDFSANASVARAALCCLAAILDFTALFLSAERAPALSPSFRIALFHTVSWCSYFASVVVLDNVKQLPPIQSVALVRMGCLVHGLPQLGARRLLIMLGIVLFLPTIIFGLVHSLDRLGVTLGYTVCTVLILVDIVAHEASVRLALLHGHLTSAAAEEASELIAIMKRCLTSAVGKTIADELIRNALPLRRCRSFHSAVILAVSLQSSTVMLTPCRQNPILGLSELHALRLVFDDVAAAYGVELLSTFAGDVVCYVNYFGDVSSPQLNARRIKGRLLVPDASPQSTVAGNARCMIEMWSTLLLICKRWGYISSTVDGVSTGGMRAASSSLWSEPGSASTQSLLHSASMAPSPMQPAPSLVAAVDCGVLCCGLSAIGPASLSLTTAGLPLFETMRLVSISPGSSNVMRVPSRLASVTVPEAQSDCPQPIKLFAAEELLRPQAQHASMRATKSSSMPAGATGLVEIACEVSMHKDFCEIAARDGSTL